MFWVNVPFCVVGFVLAWKLLPTDQQAARPRLDLVGFLLLSPGIVGILYGLTNAGAAGGFGRIDVLAPMLVGAALLAAFTIHATRFDQRALVDVRLFAHRGVASAAGLLFLSGAALYGAMLLLPLYFQDIRGADALAAGLVLVPHAIGAKWVVLAGFAIVGAATVPFALATANSSEWVLMAALLVRGFGLGAVTIPLMTAAFIGLDRTDVPHASIITRIAQQIGGSFGVALLAVILDSTLANTTGGVDSPVTAFQDAFWWATGFTALAMLLALALPGRPRITIDIPTTTAGAQGR
jgi:hypothetical protein